MAIFKDINAEATVLKFFDYKSAACVVESSDSQAQTINGRSILKAGTPYPANDATCLGYLLHDYDVTEGDRDAAYVFEGTLDPDKLAANEIEIDAAALAATPRVTIYGTAYAGTADSSSEGGD